MLIEVFIENEAGKNIKNIYDERRLEYKKSVTVSREYPYPYGFVLDTTSGDNDNLDVFVLTSQPLRQGQTVSVEPIGVLRQIDEGEKDDNILAVMPGEDFKLNDDVKDQLTDFLNHVFDHLGHNIEGLDFDGAAAAVKLIEQSRDAGL